jgi:uncharacterized repeat protein (TIGR03803 family)
MKKQVKRLIIIILALSVGIPLVSAQTFIPLYSFTDGNDGANPFASLVQASDGNFYGTTFYGGTNGYGTIFQITTGGVLTPLYSFTGGNDGANPRAGLVQANDGNLYGTALNGGTNGYGTVFRITTGGVLTTLYSFTDYYDGAYPQAGLVQASDGNLYGTTLHGGDFNEGTIFQITTGGVETPLYSFTPLSGPNFGGMQTNSDGAVPAGALVQASDGNLYGTTVYGGTNGYGTVFQITTGGVLTPLYFFTDGHDGGDPAAALVQASDGNLYGTTYFGGTNNSGVVFRITTGGALTPLWSFTGHGNDGGGPTAGLVQASDGNLYGTTVNGGTNHSGVVFQITTNGALTTLYSLTGGNHGANPYAGLVQANNGNLYGTTYYGGNNNVGTVFEFVLPPPTLNILSAGNQCVLSWPAWATNYVLQTTTNLASPNWVTVSNAISGVAVTNSSPAQYFRLANP